MSITVWQVFHWLLPVLMSKIWILARATTIATALGIHLLFTLESHISLPQEATAHCSATLKAHLPIQLHLPFQATTSKPNITNSEPPTIDAATMCNYVFTVHSDCSHKQYQNTFKCPEARGSALFQSYSNLTLNQTLHLPASTPKQIPEPLCSGQIRKVVRPVTGLCRACIREEREKQQKLGK